MLAVVRFLLKQLQGESEALVWLSLFHRLVLTGTTTGSTSTSVLRKYIPGRMLLDRGRTAICQVLVQLGRA